MKTRCAFAAVFVLLLAVEQVRAENTIGWTEDPGPGSCTGEITIKGSVSLDSGWEVLGSTALVKVWKDGLEVTNFNVSMTSTSWDTSVGGLASGSTYNITVEVTVTDQTDSYVIITAPKTAKAQ